MNNRTVRESIMPTDSVKDLMVWVAGLAALAGLIEEILRHSKIYGPAGFAGAGLVLYIVYVSLSIRSFWRAPRIVVPTTMLIGGVLWTLSLQVLNRIPTFWGTALLIAVPFATALCLRLIFPSMVEPDNLPEDVGRQQTVQTLLVRHKGMGSRAATVKPSPEPEL